MARPASEQPTDVELQILGVLWDDGPSTVRAVHNRLAEIKQTNYSTTVKMLSVMLDKKLVKRDESVRPAIFQAVATRAGTGKKVLKGVIKKLYEGSAKSLVMQALSTQKASKEDLAEIRQLIDQLEGRK